MTEVQNHQLDMMIAGFLYGEKVRRRDEIIYKKMLHAPDLLTPGKIAKQVGQTPQRVHASLLRLQDDGIAYSTSGYDRVNHKEINQWHINEVGLIQFLLTERAKDKLT